MRKWAGKKLNPNIVKIEGVIPPIIDMNTWERVQMRMNGKKNNVRNKAKREYLLTGLMECEECGASYVGHTNTRKGHEYKTYVCGNKYRTRACHAQNIKADTIESFVVAQLKQYFADTDFNGVAGEICNAVNSASNDLSAEKKELKDINAKINNGVTAVLNGLDLPELQDEIDRLRVRKSELEDIIGHAEESNNKKISKEKLIALMQEGSKTLDTDIKNHVTKIYAHADGSFTVNIGVHLMDCGSLQQSVNTKNNNILRLKLFIYTAA